MMAGHRRVHSQLARLAQQSTRAAAGGRLAWGLEGRQSSPRFRSAHSAVCASSPKSFPVPNWRAPKPEKGALRRRESLGVISTRHQKGRDCLLTNRLHPVRSHRVHPEDLIAGSILRAVRGAPTVRPCTIVPSISKLGVVTSPTKGAKRISVSHFVP